MIPTPPVQHQQPVKPRVLFTIPNGNGWIHKHVARLIPRLLSDPRYAVTYTDPTHRPYEHNLNRCAYEVLTQGYDFWLNCDTDNPPTGNPLDLIVDNLDLIGFPTPVYHDEVKGDTPWYFNALIEKPGGWGARPPSDCVGLQEVDAIGSGCFLMHSRVLRAIKPPWFMRSYDQWGFVDCGHDYLFCTKVRQAGYRIWADYNRPCQHFVETDLLSLIQAVNASYAKAPPRTEG